MTDVLLLSHLVLAAASLVILVILVVRPRPVDAGSARSHVESLLSESRRLEQGIREEMARARDEGNRSAADLREEVSTQLRTGFESVLARQADASTATERRLDAHRTSAEQQLDAFGKSNDQRLADLRRELNESGAQARDEMRRTMGDFQSATGRLLTASGDAQQTGLRDFGLRLDGQSQTLATQLAHIRETLERRLDELQKQNQAKLEDMRRTVDEKLQSTLEKRLGDSFRLVSERLEQVHQRLGEMQTIASSVGDLQRVLTNVKTRGTWGEIQLGALLEQVLTLDQYGTNVVPHPDSTERVEYAIRLPGSEDSHAPVWLPIDAKFPQEDYLRLIDAIDRADADAAEAAGRALELRIRSQGADIRRKYIAPPYTTDFAILFLPSEGLYAEALRRPGLADNLQRDHRVVLAGPTTLAALLNSLQMGFRTLAIQQRSSEVWTLLGAVKTEFGKFGDVIARVKKKLDEASNQIDETARRTRAIDRRLRDVEALPASESATFLPELAEESPGPSEAD